MITLRLTLDKLLILFFSKLSFNRKSSSVMMPFSHCFLYLRIEDAFWANLGHMAVEKMLQRLKETLMTMFSVKAQPHCPGSTTRECINNNSAAHTV